MLNRNNTSLLLRIGLAAVFFYAAGASYFSPSSWVGFFPEFLRALFGDTLVLFGFGVYQAALGLWLLSGKQTWYAALLSSATLLGIIVFNVSLLDIIFRDVGLFFAALALAASEYNRPQSKL